MAKKIKKYINREISWLSFNSRVLQEAADPATPLIERIKFLGIFSSNLDEFFRVRVAALKRMVKARRQAKSLLGEDPGKILEEIQSIVIAQQEKFNSIYKIILKELSNNEIHIIDETKLTPEQRDFVKAYFQQEVRPNLFPVMIHSRSQFPELRDYAVYLAVRMRKNKHAKSFRQAFIEIPTRVISRFLVLPKKDNKVYIILLDDVIRVGLEEIFLNFDFHVFEAYTIKLTRDAELDIDDDITMSFFEKISKSLKLRKKGDPVRFVYDAALPEDFLMRLKKLIRLKTPDNLIPGGRYHNFKDFMSFPPVGTSELQYEPLPPLHHNDIGSTGSLLKIMREKDILLNFPYQSFHYIIDLLREASIDPRVESIKICIYRLARNSNVANALINAARNGKSVTVIMELQARFDEEANIKWTDRLREEGAHILHGVPNLKVHSKLCLITRREQGKTTHYVNIATGNYNESTACIYSDHSLLTTDKRIVNDVVKIFSFFEHNYVPGTYKHLLVSPFTLREKFCDMIDTEIQNAKKGKAASILLKMNSLMDKVMTDRLYQASNAGVTIQLLIRGVCSVVPGVKGMSENITAMSIIDRFLEHSRIFTFCNNGNERMFISSADWMTRNLDRRVEVSCPIYDPGVQDELRAFLALQLQDRQKSRILNAEQNNQYKKDAGASPVGAQVDYYRYLKEKLG